MSWFPPSYSTVQLSILNVPKSVTVLLHLKKPAAAKVTFPLAAVKVPLASYSPPIPNILSVPSTSVGPLATKEPLLIVKSPSISVVPVTVALYESTKNVLVPFTTKFPLTL